MVKKVLPKTPNNLESCIFIPGVIDSVALDGDVIHEVSPLMLEEVLPTLESVKQEVACARSEMFRIVVPRAMKLKRNVCVDADGEVVVHHVHRLEIQKMILIRIRTR